MEAIPQVNQKEYWAKMAKNIEVTSKSKIPAYCKGRVLDVGCSTGELMETIINAYPECNVYGIDRSQEAIGVCLSKGLNAGCASLETFFKVADKSNDFEKYDTIIFSSVIHEIYSYDSRRDKNPINYITDLLAKTTSLLNPGGVIIIRDGVGFENTGDKVVFEYKSASFLSYIARFFKTNFAYTAREYKVSGKKIELDVDAAKEFLLTFTWGHKSWNREVQEMYGILTEKEWAKVLPEKLSKEHLSLEKIIFSPEEYEKYLTTWKFYCDRLSELLKVNTCFSVYRYLPDNNN